MRFKKGKIITGAALVMIAALGITYAAASNMIAYVEKFETGKVGITLQQLTVTDSGEMDAAPDVVEANKDVSYIPRFTSTDADCYVRAKVDIVMDGECTEPLGTEHIYGLSEDWVQQGDYFYCMKPLKKGEQSDMFKGIHIPESWDPGTAAGFEITVTAEAIQSRNFAPDFAQDMPWGAVMLEDAAKGSNCYKAAVPVTKTSEVTFTSDSGFQCSADELFDEFTGLMPGDKSVKEVNVKNRSANDMRLYLDVTSGDTALAEKLTLRITQGEDVLYYGVMSEVCKNESFNLTEIKKDKAAKLKFEIGLPVDAGNEYVESVSDLVWELKAEKIPAPAVQTGDYSNMMPYAVAALLAAAAATGLIFFRRKESK